MTRQWKKLAGDRITAFLIELSSTFEIWVPYLVDAKWRYQKFDPEKKVDFPTSFVHDSIKRFFLPRRKRIMTFNTRERWPVIPVSPPTADRLLMGIHACDSAALEYLDKVFIDSPYRDRLYEAERQRTVLAGITCDRMESVCHCTDRGISPSRLDATDIRMSKTHDGYLLQAATERGMSILDSRLLAATEEKPVRREWPKGRYPLAAPEEFVRFYGDATWYDTTGFCLTCGVCTFGCPTCTCFRIADETYKDTGERTAVWDSCQFRSYSRMAAGYNPRARAVERIKNRVLDKFAYSFLRHGRISCTGCGRCTASCPVKLSLPETAAIISEAINKRLSSATMKTKEHKRGGKK